MLKVLLRSRMEALLSVLTGAGRTKKAQSKGKLIGFAMLMFLSLFSLGTLFARIFEVLAQPLAMLDMGWLYFGMAVVMSFGVMIIGNVILAKYQLFEARDNDLLLSMPIKPIDILLSRLFLLYVLAVGIMLPVAIPALLFWKQRFFFYRLFGDACKFCIIVHCYSFLSIKLLCVTAVCFGNYRYAVGAFQCSFASCYFAGESCSGASWTASTPHAYARYVPRSIG